MKISRERLKTPRQECDLVLYVLEGEMDVYCGTEVRTASGAPAAEGFVARLGLEPGAPVLNIACGTGNVTIPLARRGAMPAFLRW
jgi:2-polyprenyl-3-methyl-5-hydroxy-6-metoxy-1,4-benzoquinol methylase